MIERSEEEKFDPMKRKAPHLQVETKRLLMDIERLRVNEVCCESDTSSWFVGRTGASQESDDSSICSQWPSSPHESDSDVEQPRSHSKSGLARTMWFPSGLSRTRDQEARLLRRTKKELWAASTELVGNSISKKDFGYQAECESGEDEQDDCTMDESNI